MLLLKLSVIQNKKLILFSHVCQLSVIGGVRSQYQSWEKTGMSRDYIIVHRPPVTLLVIILLYIDQPSDISTLDLFV